MRRGIRPAKKRLARKRAGDADSDGSLDWGHVLANCALLRVKPEDLTLWEYEALVWNNNELHRSPDDVEPPDPDVAIPLLERLNNDPRLTGAPAN